VRGLSVFDERFRRANTHNRNDAQCTTQRKKKTNAPLLPAVGAEQQVHGVVVELLGARQVRVDLPAQRRRAVGEAPQLDGHLFGC
jgi:hypothetical protein